MIKINNFKCIPVILSCMLLLGACGNNNIDDYATNKGFEDSQSVQLIEPIPKKDIKVGVLHFKDPDEGTGYTYTHDIGIEGMRKNLGLSNDQIIKKIKIEETNKETTDKALQECVDAGCNIIFSTSWGYMVSNAEFAKKYPDIYFSHASGYLSNGKNFNNYFGRIYQARYLSGIVAGMNTTSNKIGYIAAQDSTNTEVTGGINAFAMGVESVNPDAKIYVEVINTWFDAELEKNAAEELLTMGCDVISQHTDTQYPQLLAEENGVYGIGYNSDMSKDAPNSCLCSVVWNWSAYYTHAVQSLIDGTWDGSNYYGGMAEGLVGITDLADFCAPGTQEAVDNATSKILSGSFNVFDGVMETNDGRTIGKKGKTLDDTTITRNINWYYKNVIVLD